VAISDENNAIALALANARAVADRDAMAIVAEAGSSNTASYIVAGLAIATVVFLGWAVYSYYFGGPKGGGATADHLPAKIEKLERKLTELTATSSKLTSKVDTVANITSKLHASHVSDRKAIVEFARDTYKDMNSIVEKTDEHSLKIEILKNKSSSTETAINTIIEKVADVSKDVNVNTGRTEVILERLTGTTSNRLVKLCRRFRLDVDGFRTKVPPFTNSSVASSELEPSSIIGAVANVASRGARVASAFRSRGSVGTRVSTRSVPTGSTVSSTGVVPTTGATSSSVTSIVSSILDLE